MAYAFKVTKIIMRDRTQSILISGDAMRRDDNDLIAQTINLPIDCTPLGDGWRIMTGSVRTNLWARVEYRHNIRAGK